MRLNLLLLALAGSAATLCACGGNSANSTNRIAPTTYTVGGMVTNLSGTGLVLQDNGGDNLSITASGSFTFSTSIASGGTYNVTVLTQPSPQGCLVFNGAGTSGANVTTVQIACATETVLYNLGTTPDGSDPSSSLVFDTSGNLYGTTQLGGAYGVGTVFQLTPNQGTWTETVLYSFCEPVECGSGATPLSSLVIDAAGNLYGTASAGGAYYGLYDAGGVAFELTPDGNGAWTETVLHSFGNGTDGAAPLAGMVFDSAGNLYGTTATGGKFSSGPVGCSGGCGTVFELSPGAGGVWTEKILYNFCSQTDCPDGATPESGLIFDTAGNLYGTTVYGGSPGQHTNGTVFELSPGGNGEWTETVLYAFQGGGADGYNPQGGLVRDKSGNLYGTTEFGYTASYGANNGVVFELTPQAGGGWTETIVHGFCSLPNCPEGYESLAGLAIDKSGNLYGTAVWGGAFNWGTVFAISPGTMNGAWTCVPLYSFKGAPGDGSTPSASLILDGSGNLYGTAHGGTNGNGVVFELTP